MDIWIHLPDRARVIRIAGITSATKPLTDVVQTNVLLEVLVIQLVHILSSLIVWITRSMSVQELFN